MAIHRPPADFNPLEHTLTPLEGASLPIDRGFDPKSGHMLLNMGPSHPSTHGVLRVLLELDGEETVRAEPEIGYLHRGMEKVAETYGYNKFIPYTDRFDYLAPITNNIAVAMAVESTVGIEVPPRAKAIRIV